MAKSRGYSRKWEKVQKSIEELPEYKKSIGALLSVKRTDGKPFYWTLGKLCPKKLRWKKTAKGSIPLFKDLMLFPPKNQPTDPSDPAQALFDVCERFRIAYFIGSKPFPRVPISFAQKFVNNKPQALGIVPSESFQLTERERQEIWDRYYECITSGKSGRKTMKPWKPISKQEIKRQQVSQIDEQYGNLSLLEIERNPELAIQRNKKVAKDLKISVGYAKNLRIFPKK